MIITIMMMMIILCGALIYNMRHLYTGRFTPTQPSISQMQVNRVSACLAGVEGG